MGGHVYDIAIIGGGINGCGIARDAAGRGLSVLLAEQHDLASGTSSASTKLIHGGLRYLEFFEFRLVRESLIEREVLLAMAPHIIRPLRFVLPHHRELRPAWLIRLGLFLYDHIGSRKVLPASRLVKFAGGPLGLPLKTQFTRGFEYSDCWVDDARLVVLNAVDAARKGASIRVRTQLHSASRREGRWTIKLADRRSGQMETVQAKALVNAAGPWISNVISQHIGLPSQISTHLVKGSHIVVPRLFDHPNAYIFQNADKRIIFAIPFEKDFTLIGTTDLEYRDDPGAVAISPQEIRYLCNAASEYFAAPIKPNDVVWSYAGIRPLYGGSGVSAQEITRDYHLDRQGQPAEAPLINIFGGKITTYRRLAEEVLKLLEEKFPHTGKPWTHDSNLPGGEMGLQGLPDFVEGLLVEFPAIERSLIERLARSYGTMARDILGNSEGTAPLKPEDLGVHFGAGLHAREVAHLVTHEWAASVEDILWRRTKLGLWMSQAQKDHLATWLTATYPEIAVQPG